ncbi:hypothetical protein DPMN_035519 [Dreissena polymorpha]|uniref:Uncharacterized protein n=1 Tax=Dreissena polymorpha TaxID=45954 RepID=A0A9D4MAR3_DREPO|nr:hypothetical protein DPMN_035519 [Dreissena polymorpha]
MSAKQEKMSGVKEFPQLLGFKLYASDGYEGAGRLEPFQPIKSCIRRRSTGFINKLALPSNRGGCGTCTNVVFGWWVLSMVSNLL